MSKGAIVIVGATGGIGSAIVRRAAKDGYAPLILMDRMGDALNTIASETLHLPKRNAMPVCSML
jgi:short-subunit dehydrogenase